MWSPRPTGARRPRFSGDGPPTVHTDNNKKTGTYHPGVIVASDTGMCSRPDPAPGDPRGPGRIRMRFAGCPVILLLLLTTLLLLPNAAAPVQAGVGMPEIGSLQIGSYRAHLLNDSAGLRRGTNTLTVHIPDLPLGDDVTLRLYGPGGELINVPLRPLRVLSGPEGGHAVATASTAAPAHDSAASAGHAPGQAPEGVARLGCSRGTSRPAGSSRDTRRRGRSRPSRSCP